MLAIAASFRLRRALSPVKIRGWRRRAPGRRTHGRGMLRSRSRTGGECSRRTVQREVARFSFVRPGSNKVSLGPYAVASDELVVRGACRSLSGTITWKVFDNSTEAETAEDVKILDQGDMACDGETHEAKASVGANRELGISGDTGASEGQDAGESAWLTLANE